MLTITPISAVFGLVIYDPVNWRGTVSLPNIFIMAIFGLLTVQVWPTYISSIVMTPIIMKKLSSTALFHTIPLWKFFGISIIGGIVAGQFILLPCILMAATDSIKITLNWVSSGVAAGIATFPIIAGMYRFKNQQQREAQTR